MDNIADNLKLLVLIFIAAFIIGFLIKGPIYTGATHKVVGIDYNYAKYVDEDGNTKICEPRLTKHLYGDEGKIIKSYCLSADELKLKRCNSDNDCTSIEACIDGFCTVVQDGTINQTLKSEL